MGAELVEQCCTDNQNAPLMLLSNVFIVLLRPLFFIFSQLYYGLL